MVDISKSEDTDHHLHVDNLCELNDFLDVLDGLHLVPKGLITRSHPIQFESSHNFNFAARKMNGVNGQSKVKNGSSTQLKGTDHLDFIYKPPTLNGTVANPPGSDCDPTDSDCDPTDSDCDPTDSNCVPTDSNCDPLAMGSMVADLPAIDGMVADLLDLPVIDEMVADLSITEGMVADLLDLPVIDEMVADLSITDGMVADLLDLPVIDEMVADLSITDDMIADLPVTDEMVADLSITDDMIADLPVTDDMVADLLVIDDMVEDLPVIDEMVVGLPVINDMVVDPSLMGSISIGPMILNGMVAELSDTNDVISESLTLDGVLAEPLVMNGKRVGPPIINDISMEPFAMNGIRFKHVIQKKLIAKPTVQEEGIGKLLPFNRNGELVFWNEINTKRAILNSTNAKLSVLVDPPPPNALNPQSSNPYALNGLCSKQVHLELETPKTTKSIQLSDSHVVNASIIDVDLDASLRKLSKSNAKRWQRYIVRWYILDQLAASQETIPLKTLKEDVETYLTKFCGGTQFGGPSFFKILEQELEIFKTDKYRKNLYPYEDDYENIWVKVRVRNVTQYHGLTKASENDPLQKTFPVPDEWVLHSYLQMRTYQSTEFYQFQKLPGMVSIPRYLDNFYLETIPKKTTYYFLTTEEVMFSINDQCRKSWSKKQFAGNSQQREYGVSGIVSRVRGWDRLIKHFNSKWQVPVTIKLPEKRSVPLSIQYQETCRGWNFMTLVATLPLCLWQSVGPTALFQEQMERYLMVGVEGTNSTIHQTTEGSAFVVGSLNKKRINYKVGLFPRLYIRPAPLYPKDYGCLYPVTNQNIDRLDNDGVNRQTVIYNGSHTWEIPLFTTQIPPSWVSFFAYVILEQDKDHNLATGFLYCMATGKPPWRHQTQRDPRLNALCEALGECKVMESLQYLVAKVLLEEWMWSSKELARALKDWTKLEQWTERQTQTFMPLLDDFARYCAKYTDPTQWERLDYQCSETVRSQYGFEVTGFNVLLRERIERGRNAKDIFGFYSPILPTIGSMPRSKRPGDGRRLFNSLQAYILGYCAKELVEEFGTLPLSIDMLNMRILCLPVDKRDIRTYSEYRVPGFDKGPIESKRLKYWKEPLFSKLTLTDINAQQQQLNKFSEELQLSLMESFCKRAFSNEGNAYIPLPLPIVRDVNGDIVSKSQYSSEFWKVNYEYSNLAPIPTEPS